MRTVFRSLEFETFYNSLPDKVKDKIKYALNVISEIKVVNRKLIKKLVNTEFYELRILVDNEYRVVVFTIDNDNIIECEQIILLNGFVKKSTKDYKKEINKARQILDTLCYEDEN